MSGRISPWTVAQDLPLDSASSPIKHTQHPYSSGMAFRTYIPFGKTDVVSLHGATVNVAATDIERSL